MAVRGYFSHDAPDGTDFADRAREEGFTGGTVGENIAAGSPTPAGVMDGWMASPGHCANIMSVDFTHIGVGVYEHQGERYWTQVFGAF